MNNYRLRELKIELNRDCPLECLHCSSNGYPGAKECLNSERVSEIIRDFVFMGGEKVCISGGEPLCYQELPSIVDACEGIDVSIYTTGIVRNGGLKPLTEKAAELFANKGVKVIFSVHGSKPETHDAITQHRGSFNITVKAIEKAVNVGLLTEIHVVPMEINFPELYQIAKLASSLKVGKISWLRFVPQGRGLTNRNLLQLNRDKFLDLARIKEDILNRCHNLQLRMGSPFNVLCGDSITPCEAGLSILTICPDGTIKPCDAFKQFAVNDPLGNVLYHKLSEVWHGSSFLDAVRKIHEDRMESTCSSCPLYPRCNSGCLAQKVIVAGIIKDGRDPDCPLVRVEGIRDEVKAVSVF